jgi:hypothetical protein
MPIWEDRLMTTAFLDGTPAEDASCDVRIDDSSIVVNFDHEEYGGEIIYRGRNDGSGHFELTCDERPNWRASLHRFPQGMILEGYWIEGRNEGFWRIELNE